MAETIVANLKMKTKPLIDYFENLLPLTEAEKSVVDEIFMERSVRRRQFILQEGDISKHNTFVVEGCFRMFFVDEKGKEHNLQFAVENWWIGDIG
ncbi:MAG: cyclic nucleotide-binding domain-containing protein, partial [Flavobacteriaceae bacterium]